jgi:hypothetical protein
VSVFEGGFSRTYAKGLGLFRSEVVYPMYNETLTLLGCVIYGIVYGDTSFVVGIKQISSEVPSLFSLSQNYPNPFNPSTKISFAVPPSKEDRGVNIVCLIIYDALGREVTTLVNQQLKPGTYEVDWDGANYPSGIYFYQLSIGNEQLSTKKMVLIK